LLSIVCGLNYVSRTYFDEYKDDKRLIQQNTPKLPHTTILIAGMSLGRTLTFAGHCDTGLHLNRDGSDVASTVAVVQYAIQRGANIHTVIIPASHNFLLFNNAYDDPFKSRGLYLALHEAGAADLYPLPYGTRFIARYLPIIRADRWRFPIKTLQQGIPYETFYSVAKDGIHKPYTTSFADTQAAFAQAYLNTNVNFDAIQHNQKNNTYLATDYVEDNANLLLDLARYLQKRNVNLVFFYPPRTDIYLHFLKQRGTSDKFSPALKAALSQRGAIFMDYSELPAYQQRYELFWDTFHLNIKGARLFSQTFFADLEAKGISCTAAEDVSP
jgi:lysophospholipase L1-like esterase